MLVPRATDLERFRESGILVIPVDSLEEAAEKMLLPAEVKEEAEESVPLAAAALSAAAKS